MRPASDERVAAEHFFYSACRRLVQMQELHVMAWINFMNRDNVGCVIIKRGEPFLFFFLGPILLCRRNVVIRLGGALLERTWRIHGGEGSSAQILRGFFYFCADLGWNADQTTVHNVLPELVQAFGNVRDQFVRSRMLALYLLENLNGRLVRVDLFRCLCEC